MKNSSTEICYRILGVEPGSDLAAIRSSYRRLAAAYHPDRHAGDRQAQEMFAMVVRAYKHIVSQRKLNKGIAKQAARVCRRKRQGTRSDRRYNWQFPHQYIGTQVNCEV